MVLYSNKGRLYSKKTEPLICSIYHMTLAELKKNNKKNPIK